MSKIVSTFYGNATFDYADAVAAANSVSNSILNLMVVSARANAEIIWSTLSIQIDQQTIEERRWGDQHPRIFPGRSTATASAQGFTETTTTTNEGSN